MEPVRLEIIGRSPAASHEFFGSFDAQTNYSAGRHNLSAPSTPPRLPTVYAEREFVDAGGLMSYGPSVPGNFRRAAIYVDKIFKGAKPSDLPVEQPTKFGLVINLYTAKALEIAIPQSLLLRADEVIQ